MSAPAAGSSLLSANGLALSFGQQRLFEGVSLAVAPGEKVGLVGRNGTGKTSLLKILAGSLGPDAGEISRRRALRVGYLPQEFELENARTVRENIEAGAADVVEWTRRYEAGEGTENELADLLHRIEDTDGWNLDARIRAEAHALSAPPLDAPVGPLSGGEKRRVALCRALAGQPDLLLLDEPTNHLDTVSITWLEDFLRGFPGAAVFVTHDRYFLEGIATRIVELADGRTWSHPGNYTAYLEARAVRQEIAGQAERRRQRFLRAELEYVRAGVRAQRSKSRHRLDSYYAVEGLEAPPEEREMDLLLPPPPELGDIAIELHAAGARVGEGEAERWLFRRLTLSLRPGQCTGIVGRNGAGKTTLLRCCLGQRAPDEGKVVLGKRVAFNFIDQGRMQLDGAKSVIDEVADVEEWVFFGEQKLSVRAYLRRFLFADDRVRERIDRLSGGERARVMLAKVLKRGGNVLVLDEPTNDLDLGSLRMLENALVDFGGAVLVVSHDRTFLDRVCDQIVAFEDGGGVFVQPGNFSYYLEKKRERDRQATAWAAAPARPAAGTSKPEEPLRKLSNREQRELAGMEQAILVAEGRGAELEAALNDPAFYATRAAAAPRLTAELEAARAEVARLYERWQELEQRAAAAR